MKVAVIGGGIAGLTAAWRLLGDRHEPTVLEASAQPGGVIVTSRVDGFVREHAANGFLSSTDGASALCDELGVATVAAAPAAKRRWIYRGGARHAVPASPAALVATKLLSWRGKLALLGEPLRRRRDAAQAGDQSMYDFAVRRFGVEVADGFVGPIVTGVYAAHAQDVSLAAGFPQLAELDAAGGLVRGLIAKRGQARARVRPRLTAPVDGLAALPAALAARLGPRVRCGVTVTRVEARDRAVLVDGERYDAAVLAVPAAAVRALVPALADELATAVSAPAAVVFMGYDAAQLHTDTGGFGLLVAAGEAPRVLGIVFESTLWPGRAPDGACLFRMIYGGARDPSATALSDDDLLRQARADLQCTLGIDAVPRHASVVRWAHALAQYPVGHLERVARWDAIARAQRLVLCGAPYHGVAINACVTDGRRAARAIAALA